MEEEVKWHADRFLGCKPRPTKSSDNKKIEIKKKLSEAFSMKGLGVTKHFGKYGYK